MECLVPRSGMTVADGAGLTASHDLDIKVVPLLPLTVPFEVDADEIAETAALAQKLVVEQGKQPEEFVNLLRDEFLPETVVRNRNGFGLWDMHGNVSELCHTIVETRFVVRGGSFQSTPADCSSTSRSATLDESAGLRLVAVPGPKTQAMEVVGASPIRPAPDSLRNSVGMEFVLIPFGQFRMGAIDSERAAGRAEKPQHLVKISRPFYMGRYEVSQSVYEKVMDGKKVQREGSWRLATKNPAAFSRNGHASYIVKTLSDSDVAYLPVESVSWLEANEFCQELTKLIPEKNQNRRYRLPTEAEWEYACRAGSETAFSFGGQLNGADANVDGNYPYEVACKGPFQQRTEVVGRSGAPNPFGLFDMHGNVFEWCQDFFDADYYRQSPMQDPQGPSTGTGHVLRGGAWNSHAEVARRASRRNGGLDLAGHFYGFRVVLEVTP